MAQVATPTSLDEAVTSTPSSTHTSASVSPSGDALIVVPIGFISAVSRTLDSVSSTFSVTAAGWTIEVDSGTFGSDDTHVAIAWAITTASPGSGTVTATLSGNFTSIKMDVMQVASDFDTTSPISQSASAGETSPADGTFTDDFASTPNANSMLIATAIGSDVLASINPSSGSGYTKVNADGAGNAGWLSMWADGSEGTTYGVTYGATPDDSIVVAAVEIQEVQAAASIIPQIMHHRRQLG